MNGTHRWPLGFAAGLAAIGCYLGFTAAALLLYPRPFGPADNWLSDLGSSTLNPGGALVYNVGVSLTGVALVGFFWGFADWAERSSRRMRSQLDAVRILGVIGGLTTIATALVSESLNADLHGWISMWNVEMLATAAVLSGVFLYRHPAFWRPIAAWALLTEAAAVLFGFVLHTPPMEWVLIGLILGYVGLMTLNLRLAHQSRDLASGAAPTPTADPGPAPIGRQS
jgi:fluoride ion exporter CrcB/FEX